MADANPSIVVLSSAAGFSIEGAELTIWIFFAMSSVYLVTTIVYIVFSMKRYADRDKKRESIHKEYTRLRTQVETMRKLEAAGAAIMDSGDNADEWAYATKTIAEWQEKQQKQGDLPPNYDLFHKLFVVFFHDPRDAEHKELREGLIALLRNDYHVLWVYSKQEAESFEHDMPQALKAEAADAEQLSKQCRFCEMSTTQETITLNFTVFAPLDAATTLAYIHFPGDDNRVLGIRLKNAGFIAKKLDVIARASLKNLTDAQINNDSDWRTIVNKAKELDKTPTTAGGSAS